MCRGGVRAGMVAQAFRAIGFDAYSVAGGFTAWHAQGCRRSPRAPSSPITDRCSPPAARAQRVAQTIS